MTGPYRTRLELPFAPSAVLLHRFLHAVIYLPLFMHYFYGPRFLWTQSLSGVVVVFALTKQILWPLTKLVEMGGRWCGPQSAVNHKCQRQLKGRQNFDLAHVRSCPLNELAPA